VVACLGWLFFVGAAWVLATTCFLGNCAGWGFVTGCVLRMGDIFFCAALGCAALYA
jgi:hypothetical protein